MSARYQICESNLSLTKTCLLTKIGDSLFIISFDNTEAKQLVFLLGWLIVPN